MLDAQLRASASPTRSIILTSWHRPRATLPAPGDPILLVRQISDHGLPAAIRSAAREEPVASEVQATRPTPQSPPAEPLWAGSDSCTPAMSSTSRDCRKNGVWGLGLTGRTGRVGHDRD
jgi:hypothetical protein